MFFYQLNCLWTWEETFDFQLFKFQNYKKSSGTPVVGKLLLFNYCLNSSAHLLPGTLLIAGYFPNDISNPPSIFLQELLSRNPRLKSSLTSYCTQCKSLYKVDSPPSPFPNLSKMLSIPAPNTLSHVSVGTSTLCSQLTIFQPRKPHPQLKFCILQGSFRKPLFLWFPQYFHKACSFLRIH